MKINIDDTISLELINDSHVNKLYQLAESNRAHLRETLGWLDFMQSVDFIQKFVNTTQQKNLDGYEYSFVIMLNNELVGRVGLYKIDKQNKTAEIGYWIGKEFQGYGIINRSCLACMKYAFNNLDINRIELKCKTSNIRSINIAERLNFKFEGVLREAEIIRDIPYDLNLYSFIKKDIR